MSSARPWLMDGAGGVLGAVLGSLYIRHSRRSRTIVSTYRELIHA